MSAVRLAIAPVLVCLLTAPVLAARVEPTGKAVPNEVIVKIRGNATADEISGIEELADADTSQRLATLRTGTLLRLTGAKSAEAMAAALGADENVEFVEPNYIVRVAATPNDPSYPQLYGLRNTGQTVASVTGVAGADIDAEAAWSVTTGSASVVVGVIDSGVDYNHPDLAANMWSNPGGKGNAACAAGTHGFDALTGTCNPMDDSGHGTHVAGTIGAAGNNGVGVVGVNWTTSIMALKFLDQNGDGTVAGAIAAIDFAIQARIDGVNVRVLSNSWGGFPFSRALLDVINKANENDILFVASAGNSTRNTDTNPHYPSSYGSANILSVAATDSRDWLASFSNYGATTVHLGAPGLDVLSTMRDGGYISASGTSMAAPHVSGVAALILAQFPGYTTAQVTSAILAGTDPVSSLAGKSVTGGRLNAAKALGASPTPDFSIAVSPAIRTVTQGGATAFTVTINRYNGFTGTVGLAVSGLPADVTATVTPQQATTTATVTVTTSSSTQVGIHSYIAITATGGSLTRETAVALQVVTAPGACPSFVTGLGSFLTSPAGVAVGDFNNDGRTDHALTDAGSHLLMIYRRFGSTWAAAVGRAPAAVAAGDFNADGRTDLATANSGSHDVSIVLANTSGGFHTSVAYGAGNSPVSIAAGDFNRDGRTDLAVANNGSGSVSVLLAQSGGTFAAAIHYATGSSPFWVTVTDADGDGRDDLAVANHNGNTVSLLRGNGDGTFASPLQTAAGSKPSSVAAADFTGDGVIDLAVSNYGSNQVTLLSGNGDGTFASAGRVRHRRAALVRLRGGLRRQRQARSRHRQRDPAGHRHPPRHRLRRVRQPDPQGRDLRAQPGRRRRHRRRRQARRRRRPAGVPARGGPVQPQRLRPELRRPRRHHSRRGRHSAGRPVGRLQRRRQARSGHRRQRVEPRRPPPRQRRRHVRRGRDRRRRHRSPGGRRRGLQPRRPSRPRRRQHRLERSADPPGNGDGTFQSAVPFATGTAPRSVTVADLDRDGRLDLAVPARDANSVSVLRGNGDGTFQTFASYGTGTSPRMVAAADFNRDGILDLATANAGSANVSILLGNGDATFQAAVHYGAGTTPHALTVADLDADGILDLATANFGSNDVSVLTGNGNGTFDAAIPFAAGTGPSAIAAVDVTGDAVRDLVTANETSNDVTVLFSIGGATYNAPASFATGLGPVALTSGDFDRDGKIDLAVPNSGAASFSILRNTCPVPDLAVVKTHAGTFTQGGTGSYTITVSNVGLIPTNGTVTVTDTLPVGLALTSMSGTGWTCTAGTPTCTRSDALAAGASYPPIALAVRILNSAPANVTNTVTVSGGGKVNATNNTATDPASVVPATDLILLKTHTGTFAQGATGRKYTLVVRNAGGLATSGTVTVTDTLPAGLTATAMSGTGWSCNTGSLTCTRSSVLAGGASFPPITLTVNVAANAPALVVNSAAVSGGGDASPANNTATDPTVVWSTNTCASFGQPTAHPNGGPYFVLRDFNADGRVDAATSGGNGLSILLGKGDGTFHAPVVYDVPSVYSIAAGDLDLDGDVDLVTGANEYYDSKVSVLRGNGDGTFAAAVPYPSGVISPLPFLEVLDVDRDGYPDVAAYGPGTRATSVLLGNGDGSLRAAVTLTHTEEVRGWTVADVNGDSWPDLLTSTYGAELFVRTGRGDGTFDAPLTTAMPDAVIGLTVGDFNGDGLADVVATTYYDAIVLMGNGDGTFDAGVAYPVPWSSSFITAADINADSVLDLVAASGSGSISTRLGNGDGTFKDANVYSVGSVSRVAVTDFNGDGRADLAFSSYYTELAVMLGGCSDLSITKSHTGDFRAGHTGVYTIAVTNSGALSSGTITVTDVLPEGLTATSMYGDSFSCSASTRTCTFTGTLSAGTTSYIYLSVNVSPAAPATVVNTVTVSGGSDTSPANNTATDPTTIVRAADLTITKTHAGTVWTPGQNGTYTISVGNIGSGPTSGTVTVTDNLPWPFGFVSMSGPGWTCQPFTCTRSDALAPTAVYPPITLVVSIIPGGLSVTNVATVSGGGDLDPYNNIANDYTRILPAPTGLVATAASAAQIHVSWNAFAESNTQYEVHRSAGGGPYVHVGTTLGKSYIDTALTANTIYLYKVRMVESGVAGPFSLSDITNTIAYTDDPIVVRVTRIKRVHIEELRTALNASRAAAGMSPFPFSEPALAGVRIKKVHVAELRDGINQLRDFLDQNFVSFEDSTSIKAAHITALRAALR